VCYLVHYQGRLSKKTTAKHSFSFVIPMRYLWEEGEGQHQLKYVIKNKQKKRLFSEPFII